MLLRIVFVSSLLTTFAACGKGKSDGAAAGGGGGPSCTEAAAFYLDAHVKGGGNQISGLKPPARPDEIKTLTAAFEADCNKRPWSAQEKTCIMAIKNLLTDNKCFKGLQVSQMVFDAAKSIKDARAAGGSAAP
jgi:hypothetical protein